MNKEEIRHFKALLRQVILRHKSVLLDDKFQSELLNIIKDYEQLEQQNKKQKEVIDRILNETKETRNIINNNRDDNMLSKGCLLSYLEIVEDLLNAVSE